MNITKDSLQNQLPIELNSYVLVLHQDHFDPLLQQYFKNLGTSTNHLITLNTKDVLEFENDAILASSISMLAINTLDLEFIDRLINQEIDIKAIYVLDISDELTHDISKFIKKYPLLPLYMVTGHDNEVFKVGQAFQFIKDHRNISDIPIHVLPGDGSTENLLSHIKFSLRQIINQ